MCSLRVRATSSPSGATTIAVLKPSPSVAVGALVERGVDVDAGLRRHPGGEAVGRAAGQLLGLGAGGLRAGRVDREVAAQGQLLQADQLGALAGGELDPGRQRRLVLVGVRVPALLDGGDAERLALGRAGAGRRLGRVGGDDQPDLLHATTVATDGCAVAFVPLCARRTAARRMIEAMSATIDSTPAADGFRMPGEFEPHDGCWMALAGAARQLARLGAEPAQEAFAAVADGDRRLRAGDDGAPRRPSSSALARCSRRRSASSSSTSDDAWMRDIGPTFVVDGAGGRRGVDWRFNAWGGIYSPWDRDERVAAAVLEVEGAERYRAPLVLEGGSIHVDGEGTVLTTEECLLNPNRNPELSREQIERALLDYLGAEKVRLARARRLRGRDRRPRRQPRLLRPARRRAADLERGRVRPAARDLARRAGAARSGDRCPRPAASR